MKWNEVAASDSYQSLSESEKEGIRDNYFNEFISPQLKDEERESAYSFFRENSGGDIQTSLEVLDRPREVGGAITGALGNVTSGLGDAARGVTGDHLIGEEELNKIIGINETKGLTGLIGEGRAPELSAVPEFLEDTIVGDIGRSVSHALSDLLSKNKAVNTYDALEALEPYLLEAQKQGKPISKAAIVKMVSEHNNRAIKGEGLGNSIGNTVEAGFDSVADKLKSGKEFLEEDLSHKLKRDKANSQLSGEILDMSTWDAGKDPSMSGWVSNAIDVFGSITPQIAMAYATRGRSLTTQMATGAATGAAQASGAATEGVKEEIGKLSDEELAKQSTFFADLIAEGIPADEARASTLGAIEQAVSNEVGLVAGVGGAISGYIFRPIKKLGGKTFAGRVGAKTFAEAVEEGAQETVEGVVEKNAYNKQGGFDKDVWEDSFGNFVMGVLGGTGAGVTGAVATTKAEDSKKKQKAEQEEFDETLNESVAESLNNLKEKYTSIVVPDSANMLETDVPQTPSNPEADFTVDPEGNAKSKGYQQPTLEQDNVIYSHDEFKDERKVTPKKNGLDASFEQERKAGEANTHNLVENKKLEKLKKVRAGEFKMQTNEIDRMMFKDTQQYLKGLHSVEIQNKNLFDLAREFKGISKKEALDNGVDPSIISEINRQNPFNPVFTKDGLSFDGFAEALNDNGVITPYGDDLDGVRMADYMADVVDGKLSGEHSPNLLSDNPEIERLPDFEIIKERLSDDYPRLTSGQILEALTSGKNGKRRAKIVEETKNIIKEMNADLHEQRQIDYEQRIVDEFNQHFNPPNEIDEQGIEVLNQEDQFDDEMYSPDAPNEIDDILDGKVKGKVLDKPVPDVEEINQAAAETNTEPTEAQAQAGNYKKGRIKLHGLNIAIENPKGSTRSGTDPNGKKWSTTMNHHYGDIKRTEGADGDSIDVFIGEKPESEEVFVVDQVDAKGQFDEHKVMMGFDNKAQAITAYKSNYSKGWKVGKVASMKIEEFKDWLKNGDTTIEAQANTEPTEPPTNPDQFDMLVFSFRTNRPNDELHADIDDYVKDIAASRFHGYHGSDFGKGRDKVTPEQFKIAKKAYAKVLGVDSKEQKTEAKKEKVKPKAKPKASSNKIFTEDAAEKARALLKSKLNQLNSGVDPEVLQAGITLAGYHIEKGARSFSAFSKAMLEDLGDMVKPYLKSWYMGVKYDPRAADFEGMSSAAEVEAASTEPEKTTTQEVKSDEPKEEVEQQEEEPATPYDDRIIEHTTKKGKVLEGMILENVTKQEAQVIDKYTFKKEGGFFIRKAHFGKLADSGLMDAPIDESIEVEEVPAEVEKGDLSDFLYDQIGDLTDNRKLKAAIAEFNDVPLNSVDPEMLKDAQEALEVALVKQARDTVRKGMEEKATYDELVKQYLEQPLLNVRSSTSMENQAYSTPAPIAFVASQLAGIETYTKVYEPTAGNGMLLIGADIDSSVTNELNDLRANNLEKLGFKPTQNDATKWNPGANKFDAAIMNPPFGRLRNDEGKNTPIKHEGYTIHAIDHLITIKALESLKNGGKASIIIGADKATGKISMNDRIFFNWLYSHYDVVSHFEIDGKLYNRQGAGWPIRVITVHGRKLSKTFSPKSGEIKRLNTWDQIYDQYNAIMESIESKPIDGRESDTQPENEQPIDSGNGSLFSPATDSGKAGSTNESRKPSGSKKNIRTAAGNTSGNNNTGKQSRNSSSNDGRGKSSGSDQPVRTQEKLQTTVQQDSLPPRPSYAGKSNTGDKDDQLSASDFQVPYQVRSNGFNDSVLMPKNMANALGQALENIENEIGKSVDDYVMEKLGYANSKELFKAFMGLQVDSIAAAIYNHEVKNKGIVIADQTGVGKGRQAAGMIRYALKNGKTPIFATVADNLFTDMYDDMHEIGMTDFKPYIINGGVKINSKFGNVKSDSSSEKRKMVMQQIIETGELPAGYDVMFMTYHQINTDNTQRKVVEALNEKAFFVLDESHNVAGARENLKKVNGKSTTVTTGAGFMYQQLADKPVVYLSATFAKRPDNMPIYFRTDLMDAVDSVEELVDAVTLGGVPLQQVLSNMLAESGQLFRRERSFEGIEIPTVIDYESGSEHRKIADSVTEGLRAVVDADKVFESVFFEQYEKLMEEKGGAAGIAGNKAASTVDHQNFNSIVHNYVRQMLLALKAKKAIDHAIEAHNNGEKPVIALETTMGSFLSEFVEQEKLMQGDEVNAGYREVLLRALERTRRISVTDEKGDKKKVQIETHQLDPITKAAYLSAEKTIQSLDVDGLPLSPIDYMRDKLEEAGIKTAEITGRELRIDYSGGNATLSRRDTEERTNKRGTVDKFNTGELDALILNVSGSTGLSIHASEKAEFTDKKPRKMIVAQAMQDINVLMQMLGRINRTGQVVTPKYIMMGLDLPAEKRPQAATARKMASLNANTSANDKSDTSIDAPDMLNKYGDEVFNEYLKDNKDIARALNVSHLIVEGDSTSSAGLAMVATGRMALLSVKKQVEIYADVEQAYHSHIDYLNKTNQNDLIAQTLELDAKILDSKVIYEGKDPNSIFGGNTTLHRVDVKYQGKPPTAKEVEKALAKGEKLPNVEAILQKKESDKGKELELEKGLLEAEKQLAKAHQKDDEKAISKAAEKVESFKERISSYGYLKETNASMLRKFKVGNHVRLDIGDDVVTGVVVAVKDSHKKGSGNPFALSKTRVTIMVNSGVRQIELPLTKLENDVGIYEGHLNTSGTQDLENIFKPLPGNLRENRFIATGNLINAMANLDGGRIINFTDNQGEKHQGIIMPRKYGKKGEFETAGGGRIALRDPMLIVKLLREVGDGLEGVGGIYSAKQSVKITSRQGQLKLLAAKANKDSIAKSVKFDQGIRDIVGDLYGSGTFMAANISDSQLEAVVKRLLDITPLYVSESMRENAERLGLPKKSAAIKSFNDEKPLYRQSDTTSPVTEESFSHFESQIKSAYPNAPIEFHYSHESLPVDIKLIHIRDEVEGQVAGMFYQGKIYIVGEAHESNGDLLKTFLHETVAHYGLKEMLGDQHKSFINDVWEMMKPEQRIDIARRHKIRPIQGQGKVEFQARVAEEYIAEMAENNETPSIFDRIISFLKAAIRRIQFFESSIPLSDNEIKVLLAKSKQKLSRNKLKPISEIVLTRTVKDSNGKTVEMAANADRVLSQIRKKRESAIRLLECVNAK